MAETIEVAPQAGAWIETPVLGGGLDLVSSPLKRGRGLKLGGRPVHCLASIRIPGRRSLFFPDASAGCYSAATGVGRPFLASSTR